MTGAIRRPAGALLALLLLAAAPAGGEDALPATLQGVAYDQRLGARVPLDAPFTDDGGRQVSLGDYFGSRPVILALVYYDCPMLCTLVLNGLTATLKTLDFDPGREFEVVAVSFDPREGPELAAAKKAVYLERYGRRETAAGWHFLTGEDEAIRRLTEAAGFRYRFDEGTGQFAHAAGILVVTPEGQIARYFYGVEYPPRDVRLGLVEAARERIGSVVDQVLLYCFHYDPATGRYSAAAMNLVRLGGAATLLGLGLLVGLMLRRERAVRRPARTEGPS